MQFDFCCVISHCFAHGTSTGWQSNRLLRSQHRNEWQSFKVENVTISSISKQNCRSSVTEAVTESSFQLLFCFNQAKMFCPPCSLFLPLSHPSSSSFSPTLQLCGEDQKHLFQKRGIFHVFSLKTINASFDVHVIQGTSFFKFCFLWFSTYLLNLKPQSNFLFLYRYEIKHGKINN